MKPRKLHSLKLTAKAPELYPTRKVVFQPSIFRGKPAVSFREGISPQLHSLKLTWHLKITPWKRRFLLETIIFRGKLLVSGRVSIFGHLWGSHNSGVHLHTSALQTECLKLFWGWSMVHHLAHLQGWTDIYTYKLPKIHIDAKNDMFF